MSQQAMCELVIESRDLYTYHAVTWYIGTVSTHVTSSLAAVVNARDPSPKILHLARGDGTIGEVSYACEETAEAFCTDARPEPWRKVILRGPSRDALGTFVERALRTYRERIATLRANDGVTLYAWDDNDGWVSVGDAPHRPIESLLLPGNVGPSLLRELKDFVAPHTHKTYALLNIPMIKILLLHGVPGSGKTSLVRCLASELGMNIANFAGEDMHTFSEALVQAPAKSIVSVEDIDCVLGTSGNQREKRGFAQLLSTLDAVTRKDPLIVCLTTNFPGGLDVAVRRRVDHCIEFKYATKAQAVGLIERFFPSIDTADRLWDDLTDRGRRSIAMATLQKFLVRGMKHATPWALLEEDPDAFSSLLDVVSTESPAGTMYM